MEFLELAKSRYSVRKFKKEQISDEELAAVLDRLCEKTDERLARIYDIMNSMSGKV